MNTSQQILAVYTCRPMPTKYSNLFHCFTNRLERKKLRNVWLQVLTTFVMLPCVVVLIVRYSLK